MLNSIHNYKVVSSLVNGAKQALPHSMFLIFSTLIPIPIQLMGAKLKVNLPLTYVAVDISARCDQNSKIIKNRKSLAYENHKLLTEYFFYGLTTLIPKIFFKEAAHYTPPEKKLMINLPTIAINFAAEVLYHGENSAFDTIKEEVTYQLDYLLGGEDNFYHYPILGVGFILALFLG